MLIRIIVALPDIHSKLDETRRDQFKSSLEYDWTIPESPTKKFQYPNEYNVNPTPSKVEHVGQHGRPDLQQYKSVSNFYFPNEYPSIPPNNHQQIPDVNLNIPDTNQNNPVPIFEYPNQYNPTASSIPGMKQYKPDSSHNNPAPKFQYPNEYNPTQPTPNVPKINQIIWVTRRPKMRRTRPYYGQRQRRPFRPRRPSRIRRPHPCRPTIWGYYYGYYGKIELLN